MPVGLGTAPTLGFCSGQNNVFADLVICHELEAVALSWSSVPQYCWCLTKHSNLQCIKFAVIVYKKAHMREQQLHQHMACMCEAQSSNTIISVFIGTCGKCGASVEY